MCLFFSDFIRNSVSKKINVQDEISNFKRNYPNKNPVVIYDVIASLSIVMPQNFVARKMELLCAGRLNQCSLRAKQIFENFKKLNVKLVFFVDGHVKRNKLLEWADRRNNDYNSQKKGLFQNMRYIDSSKENLTKMPGGNLLKSYFDNFLIVAKDYGEIFISLENECDIDIAQYAAKINAFAIIAGDMDFILMPNLNWKIWSTRDFNFEDFTVTETDKNKLRKCLPLNDNQLPILTLLHRRSYFYSNIFDVENNSILKDIIPTEQKGYSPLINFIKRNFPSGIPLPENEFKKLCKILYDNNRLNHPLDWVEKKVKSILDNYDYENAKIFNDLLEKDANLLWLHKHIKHTNSTLVYTFLNHFPITISHNFIDLSIPNTRSYADLVIPLICRQIGVVLYDEKSLSNEIEIFYKPNDLEKYQSRYFSPIYPDKNIPNIKNLLNNENGNNEVPLQFKFNILSWIITSKFGKIDYSIFVKYQKTPFLIPIIALYYLVKENHFTVKEADIILLSIYQAVNAKKEINLRLPKYLDRKAFWIAYTYTQIKYFFRNSFIVCGLYDYIESDYFDGFIFHKLYTLKDELKFDLIKNYRIYSD